MSYPVQAFLAAVFAFAGVVYAQRPADLVQAKLLADVSAIQPGEPFRVAVHFKMAPGWHIYWINPGDSGESTKIDFTVPAGFKVGELKFPVPERFILPGDITSYGYEDEVTLLATVTPPADLHVGEPIEISAKATWLVCEKICLPGDAALATRLPVSGSGGSDNQDLFKTWTARLPVPAAQAGAKVSQSYDEKTRRLTIQLDWSKNAPSRATWFPPMLEDANITGIRVQSSGQRTTISATVQPFGEKSAARTVAQSVLAYDDGHGARNGVIVNFVPGTPEGKPIPQD